MVGGRKTHEFPHGRPRPLTVNEICFPVAMIATMVFGATLEGWRRFVPFGAVLFVLLFAHSLLLRHYERTGRAMPIKRERIVVRYVKGLPVPIVLARASLFATAAIMLISVLLLDSTARPALSDVCSR
jgi:hypothetical protein